MTEDKALTKKLIEIYEKRKGKKGQFSKIVEYYHEMIMQLHHNNKSVSMITTIIESKLEYTFSDMAVSPFHRAVYAHIQKHTHKNKVEEKVIQKSGEYEKTKSVEELLKENKSVTEPTVKENLGRESTDNDEIKDLFK